jgi:LAGLIDADG-like domain
MSAKIGFTGSEIDHMLKLRKSGVLLKEIAREMRCSDTTVSYICTKYGIKRSKWPFTPQQDAEIIKLYLAGESSTVIGQKCSSNGTQVLRCLKKYGITRRGAAESHRTYIHNEHAFSEIAEESAYWIGFLMADGCIHNGKVQLTLGHKDAIHVAAFRSFLGSNHPIHKRPEASTLAIPSRQLIDDLAKYGVVPRKTETAKVIGLEDNRHFWRGVIDGDGSVSIYKTRGAIIDLTGSYDLLCQWSDFICEQIGVRIKVSRRNGTPVYKAVTSGSSARKLISLLYCPCSIALQRKLAMAQLIVNFYGG